MGSILKILKRGPVGGDSLQVDFLQHDLDSSSTYNHIHIHTYTRFSQISIQKKFTSKFLSTQYIHVRYCVCIYCVEKNFEVKEFRIEMCENGYMCVYAHSVS